MIVDRYYYGKLPENEKIVYKEIYQGCMEHKDVIPISTSREDIGKSFSRIIAALMDDNPLLYFINQSMFDFAIDANENVAAIPQYIFTYENVKKYNQKIQDTANRLIADLNLTDGSELEKVRKVHDYMCGNICYDHEGSDPKDIHRFIASHNIIGVFAHKKAQCEGIAKATKVLLNAVDVKCIFISGKADSGGNGLVDHGWNIVNIGGNAYHVDITFDIGAGSSQYIAYDYYNITDAQIRKNHVFSTGCPKCTSTAANYFETNNTVFSGKGKLLDYIKNQINNGNKSLYFRLTGRLKAKDICDDMMEYGYQLLCEHGEEDYKGQKIINEDMNICRITYI